MLLPVINAVPKGANNPANKEFNGKLPTINAYRT